MSAVLLALALFLFFRGSSIGQFGTQLETGGPRLAKQEIGDLDDTKIGKMRAKRQEPSEAQIVERVKSLLDLRSDEIRFVAIPSDASGTVDGEQLAGPGESPMLRFSTISREKITPALEDVLRSGKSLKSMISEPSQAEFVHRDAGVMIMKTNDGSPDRSKYTVVYKDPDVVTTRVIEVAKGDCLFLSRSDQDKDRILVVAGSD